MWVYILDLLANILFDFYCDKNPKGQCCFYIWKDWFEINYTQLSLHLNKMHRHLIKSIETYMISILKLRVELKVLCCNNINLRKKGIKIKYAINNYFLSLLREVRRGKISDIQNNTNKSKQVLVTDITVLSLWGMVISVSSTIWDEFVLFCFRNFVLLWLPMKMLSR